MNSCKSAVTSAVDFVCFGVCTAASEPSIVTVVRTLANFIAPLLLCVPSVNSFKWMLPSANRQTAAHFLVYLVADARFRQPGRLLLWRFEISAPTLQRF